jgi:lipoprotein-releasing system permease protein
LLGFAGLAAGLPLGCGLMFALMQVRFKPPGLTEEISMPLDWSACRSFLVAGRVRVLSRRCSRLICPRARRRRSFPSRF